MTKELRAKNWLVRDCLTYAAALARRLQEATEGTEETLLFDAVANDILKLRDDSPSMVALNKAALHDMMIKELK
jgi:hypothetical protein